MFTGSGERVELVRRAKRFPSATSTSVRCYEPSRSSLAANYLLRPVIRVLPNLLELVAQAEETGLDLPGVLQRRGLVETIRQRIVPPEVQPRRDKVGVAQPELAVAQPGASSAGKRLVKPRRGLGKMGADQRLEVPRQRHRVKDMRRQRLLTNVAPSAVALLQAAEPTQDAH